MGAHALNIKPPAFYLNLFPDKICGTPRRHVTIPVFCRQNAARDSSQPKRRDLLIAPLLAVGAYALRSAVARAEEKLPLNSTEAAKEEVVNSRIYDATAIGEPMAVGKEKRKVWEKMMDARIVYLGEAEQVPTRDDKELELQIVRNLSKGCVEADRPLSLALEAFPCDLQEQLDRYVRDKRSI